MLNKFVLIRDFIARISGSNKRCYADFSRQGEKSVFYAGEKQNTTARGNMMKFVMSYSCGKDSTLALHKMIADGHIPVGLLVVFSKQTDRSFCHGATRDLLERYAAALEIPLILCASDGQDYPAAFEKGLQKAVQCGAEAACFGDIDLDEHKIWGEERFRNAGLLPVFPLWQKNRTEAVHEFLALGYQCVIKTVNKNLLPRDLLGRRLDGEVLKIMAGCGIDICDENGEYHTLAVDGPVFKKPLEYHMGEILDLGDYPVIDIF